MKNIMIAALAGATLLLGLRALMPPVGSSEVMVKGQTVDSQGHVNGTREMSLSEALTQLQRNIIETQYLIAKTSKDTNDKIDAVTSKMAAHGF